MDISRKQKEIQPNRIILLTLACILLVGNYYCYDLPASISTSLQKYLGQSDDKWAYTLNGLYSTYSVPNLILPIFAGQIIDKLGPNKTVIVFALLTFFAQMAFLIGTHYKDVVTMMAARMLFGIGGEALEVAQAVLVTTWFPSNAGLVLGLTLTAARLSTALNDNVSPYLYHLYSHPNAPNLVALIISFTSVLAAIFITLITRKDSRNVTQTESDDPERQSLLPEESNDGEVVEAEQSQNAATNFFKGVHPAFWALCAACVLCYATVNPYIHILQGYLEYKYYPGNPIFAARIMSIPDLMSSIGSPIIGYLLDKYGFRSIFLPFSSVLILLVHLIVMNTHGGTPIPQMLLLGVAYSIFAASLWPCVPALVSSQHRATAYGVMTVAMNIALTLGPLLVGALLEKGGYRLMEIGFCIGSGGAILSGLALFGLDYRNGKHLIEPADSDE